MRLRAIILLCLAIFFGGASVFVARIWLEGQRGQILAQAKQAPSQTIVVAKRAFRFGEALKASDLTEIPWGSDQLPKGTFAKRSAIFKDGSREVLTAIDEGEPIFATKLTGPGQRATLSTIIAEDMKAITIRVNDVLGVAGFVLPGDRVDLLLTRNGSVSVLLQGVKVLAIDQTADEARDKPTVVKSVTFEVSTQEAQKLTLAASVGQLSLALRNRASAVTERTRNIGMGDLNGAIAAALKTEAGETPAAGPKPNDKPLAVSVGVWRALKRTGYKIKPSGELSLDEALVYEEVLDGDEEIFDVDADLVEQDSIETAADSSSSDALADPVTATP